LASKISLNTRWDAALQTALPWHWFLPAALHDLGPGLLFFEQQSLLKKNLHGVGLIHFFEETS